MIRDAIERHIDRDAWAATAATQEDEKAMLEVLADRVTEAPKFLENFFKRLGTSAGKLEASPISGRF
jgi:hypothetical protein